MLGCPAHIRRMLTSRMVSDLVCSMAAASDVFSPLMSMIFTAYSLCVAFSTTRRTVLLMPLPHTTSHTRHTMFQLLTLSNTSLLTPLPVPHSNATHRSPQVSTVHTHFKQHQFAHAPTTQQCLPYTGHPTFQLLTLTHVNQHQSADARASTVPNSNVHHTQVTPCFNCSH